MGKQSSAVAGRMGTALSILWVATLAGCGGGGGGDSPPSVPNTPSTPNTPPTANAGSDQAVEGGISVALNGSGADSDGTIASYAWTQTGGTAVSLSSASAAAPTFTTPLGASASALTFSLVVTDNSGSTSNADAVTINVNSGASVSGKVTFARVPFGVGINTGLAYLLTTQVPARGITVEAINADTSAVFSTAATNETGDYTILVPANAGVKIRAKAEMVRAAPTALPHWHFQVNDVDGANTPYTYEGARFTSGVASTTQNVDIPSGWDEITRTATATRASAPFAILDTVHKAFDFILTVAPTADFPQLTLDWAPSNAALQTFYDNDVDGTPVGINRRIQLAGEADADTDEFDEAVIAHEFGHYVEDIFSRSDNIGDAHAAGDRLDPRVAFGEGFGYAFAAMVLDDPLLRDSYGANQSQDGYFNIEDDSTLNEGWYSESSMQEIIWDLYDVDGGGADTVTLGFAPIWAVLTGAQRDTEAVTSIFPFIVALKAQNLADAPGISALVDAEGMNGTTIAEFGTTETNDAGAVTATDVIPIYTPITVGGGPVTVRSTSAFGTPNKLSNQRFLLLDVVTQSNLRFTATGPVGRDVDLFVLNKGATVAFSEAFGDENFTANLPPGRYVLDTYDCENAGCGDPDVTPNPMPVDITITVTAN